MQYRVIIKHVDDWYIGWLVDILGVSAEKTCKKICDGANALQEIARGNTSPHCGYFTSFFGRGQQYLSFIERTNLWD